MKGEIEKTEVVHKGWTTLRVLHVRLPDGRMMKREVENHGNASAVLAYDPARKVALQVRQLRWAPYFISGQESVAEAIAGIQDEADAAGTARREAMEEAGLRLDRLDHAGSAWSSPGISTERIDLFLAEYSVGDRVGDGGGLADEYEEITVEEIPLRQLARMADDGAIDDLKTLALVQTLRLRKPELFHP